MGFDSDSVYAANVKGQVSRYGLQGDLTWREKLEPLSAGVGVGESLVLLATTNGVVVALNSDNGTEKWRKDVRGA